jgi:hypothetical protein
MEAREVDAQSLIEPVLDKLVEQHEILGIEDDARRIAMMEADQLVALEMGGSHGMSLLMG